jgi:hypothetical protein
LIELLRILAGEAFRVEEGKVALLVILDQTDHSYGLSDPSS